MANLRTKGKSTIVWVLMGMLVLGLGGFGVTNFGGGQTEVGRVGDTTITASDYARAPTVSRPASPSPWHRRNPSA